MQAWMSEGLLWWGGAFQRLWTAVPPVITTLNLAGHSSAPLIEHLNLTRCYCHVLTNRQMPCYPPPPHHFLLSRLLWDISFSPLSHAWLPQTLEMRGEGRKRELEGYCLLNKSNNSTSLDGYITRGQLVSCHVLPDSHFEGLVFTFPMWFHTATTLPLTLILSLTQGLTLREVTCRPLLDRTMFTDTFNLQLFASGGLIESMAAFEWWDFPKGYNKVSIW